MASSHREKLAAFRDALADVSMPEALDLAAEQFGDQLAIVHIERGTPPVTWREFRELVSGLRTGLADMGVSYGDRVAIMLRNQLEFPVAWWAATSLGAAIVPINPRYTSRETAYVLSESRANWLIVLGELIESLDPTVWSSIPRDHLVIVDGDSQGIFRSFQDLLATPSRGLDRYPSPNDLANVQFTSGTTGLPKGCLLTHRYWLEVAVSLGSLFGAQRILADHPFFYMQNQSYLLQALASGGAIYVTNGMSRRKFMGWLSDHQIDFAWIDGGVLDLPRPKGTQLHLTRTGIAKEPAEVVTRLQAELGVVARPLYASTEVGIGTFVPWDRKDLALAGSIGFCLPNREAKVVDEAFAELGPGEVGELCFRGDGVMRGYDGPVGRSDAFTPDGWFRTGDIAYRNEEGALFYEGRLKDTIRRSGETIAATEVEMVLGQMSGVSEVAVVPVPSPERGEEVKAIVVLQPTATASAAELVAYASEHLAAYKVPRYVEFRDQLPHTPSGKIQKSLLRAEAPLSMNTLDMANLALPAD